MKAKVLKTFGELIVKNKNTLLTIAEILGIGATGYISFKCGMKAQVLIDDMPIELDEFDKKEKNKIIAKKAIVPAAAGLVTAGICVFHNYINVKDLAAMAALYKLSEKKRTDYIEGVKRTVGEKKEEEARATASKVSADEITHDGRPWIKTGKGEYPCIDLETRSKFYSTIEDVKGAFNRINDRLMDEDFIPINDLLFELGCESLGDLGAHNGFRGKENGGKLLRVDNGNLHYDVIMLEEGPALAISYDSDYWDPSDCDSELSRTATY